MSAGEARSAMAPPAVRRVLRSVRRHAGVVGSVVSVSTDRPTVVLTFDDGPQPGGTDRVLSALRDHRATATFFVLLTRARRFPSLLADVVAEGHEVALHGLDHTSLTTYPYQVILRRTRDAAGELEDRTGSKVRWIRPPYGRQTLRSWHAVKRVGLVPVMWSASTWDSRHVTDAERLATAGRAMRGDILLAHDGFAGPSDGAGDGPEPAVDRAALTDRVLAEFRSRDLQGRSMGEALMTGTAVRVAWFKR